MKTLLNTRFTRLTAASCLALAVAACGSDNDDPAPTPVSSSAAMSSSSAAMSSSSQVASSSVAASSSDAASSSVVASSSSSVMAVPVAAFSWDFEAVSPGVPAINGWNYTGATTGGTNVEVVEGSGLGYSGNIALQVTTADTQGSFLTINNFSGTHWGRVYYKVTDSPDPVPTWSHTTLVAAYDSQTQTQYRLVDMVAAPNSDSNAGKYQHLYNIDNPSRIDLSLEGGYTHTYNGDWVCLEWQVDAVDQEYHVFFNGNELALSNVGNPSNATDLQDADNWNSDNVTHDFVPVPASFDQLKIGIQNYQGHAYSVLIDDIAISDAQVGCFTPSSSSAAMSSSSEAASSSAPSGPTQAERVAAGLALYEEGNAANNSCVLCHGADGAGGLSEAITDSTRTYDELVTLIGNGGGGMPECAPAGNCAEQLTDYVWVTFLNGTLTNDGGTR